MPKTIKKSDKLPKQSYQLIALNDLLMASEQYKGTLDKGLRFYTTEQLNDLEKRYEDGMTWKEIDSELAGQGMIFKKATFRKYIQEKKLPPSIDYKKSSKGREAVYPKDTIKYINLFQYLHRIADNKTIDALLTLLSSKKVTAAEAIKGQLESQNLREGVFMYLRYMSTEGDDIEKAIGDILGHDPEFCDKAISGLEKIQSAFEEQYDEWVDMLEKYEVLITPKTNDEE